MKTLDNEGAGDEARTRDVHLGKNVAPRWHCNTVSVTVLVLYFVCFAVFATAARPKPQTRESPDRIVNETLDTVMWVHEQHKGKITWDQLFHEVCRHMQVKRTEPWNRH